MGAAISEDEVKGLFNLWNDALATLDPKEVADRYARGGVLLPTVSDTPRTDHYAIVDYFTNFLKLKPQGEILESNVMIGHNWCQVSLHFYCKFINHTILSLQCFQKSGCWYL